MGNSLDKDVAILKRFIKFAFNSLEGTCEGVSEKEANWKPIEESNNIRWILNHVSRISNLSIPGILKGNPNFAPKGWNEDYRNQTYAIEKLMEDINSGKKITLQEFDNITSKDLAEEIPLWGGTRPREFALFAYVGELINHKGQIAALRGNIKRRREKEQDFLI